MLRKRRDFVRKLRKMSIMKLSRGSTARREIVISCCLTKFEIIDKLVMNHQPLCDYSSFRKQAQNAKNIVVLTGAGISAESGVPTFRGAGGLWRTYQAQAHLALADFEAKLSNEGRRLTVITQNIDELHKKAGTNKLIELHGSLFKTLCTVCSNVNENNRSPICEGLKDKGAPDEKTKAAKIPLSHLPRCEKKNCGGLLRPYVVWFGENLDQDVLNQAQTVLENCDFCIVVGTSAVVYPAAMFAPQVARRGFPVAEFNIERTPNTQQFRYYFEGPCATTLPKALSDDCDSDGNFKHL